MGRKKMDIEIFEKMDASELRNYIQFLIWHYQVMDSFWYLNIAEKFGQPVADELNEKVLGRIPGMAAKDLVQRFKIKGQGLSGFLKALQYWPWTIIVGYKIEEKADEVIKRLVKGEGSGAIVITSDRDVSRFAERMEIAAIPSEQFREKLERGPSDKCEENPEEEENGIKKKGPSRRLSKREKRASAASKKL
jgi:hypothetical protein